MPRILALLALVLPLIASDFVPTSGAWDIPTNWNPAHVPTSTDDVVIGAGKTVTVSPLATPPEMRHLQIDGTVDAASSTPGSVIITVGGNLTVQGTFRLGGATGGCDAQLILASNTPTVSGAGSILCGPGVAGAVVSLQPGTAVQMGGGLTISGSAWTIEQTSPADGGASNLSAQLTIQSGATLDIPSGACQVTNGVQVQLQGTLRLGTKAQLRYDGSAWSRLTVGSTGVIDWTINGNGLAGILLPGSVTQAGTLILRRPQDYRPAIDDVVTLIDLCFIGITGSFTSTSGLSDWADVSSSSSSSAYAFILERQTVDWSAVPSAVGISAANVTLPAHTQVGVAISYTLQRDDATTPVSTLVSGPALHPGSVAENLILVATAPRTVSGATTYDALYETHAITIGASLTQNVTIDALVGPWYYGQQVTLSGTSASGAALAWSTPDTTVLSIVGNVATVIGTSTSVTIQAHVPTTGPYLPGSASTSVGPVLARPLTVVVDGGTRAYGAANPTPSYTVDGLAPGDGLGVLGTVTYTGTGATANATTLPGTYPISATFPSASPTYQITVTAGSLVITQLPQTLTFNAVPSLLPGGSTAMIATSDQGLPVTFSSSDPAIASVSGSTLRGVAPGTATITASQAGSTTVLAATATRTVTVNPPPVATVLTLTPLPGPYAYGDTVTLSGTASSGATITWTTTSSKLSITGTTATVLGTGTGVTVTASVPAVTGYLAATASITLGTLVARPVTVTVDSRSRVFGDTTPAPSCTAVGLRAGDAVSVLGTATYTGTGTSTTASTPVGTYPTSVGFSPTNSLYAVTVVPGSLTITARPQSLALASTMNLGRDLTTTLPGTTDAGIAVTYISSDPATATVSGTVVHGLAPGDVTITATAASDANHLPLSTSTVLTVFGERVSQTITVTGVPATLVYGDAFTVSATCTSNASVTWSTTSSLLSLSGTAVQITSTGAGASLVASAPETTGYWAAVSTIPLPTIGLRPVTVTVDGGSRYVGDPNPTPILTCTNLAPGETLTSLGTPTWGGTGSTATTSTAAGTYPLTVTFPPSATMTITVTPGSLVIRQRSQTVTLAMPTSLRVGRSATVTATSDAGLPVTLTSSAPSLLTINGTTLNAVAPGQVTITATQAGTALYAAASATATITVLPLLESTTNVPAGTLPLRYGDTATLPTTASSGAPITWTLSASSAAVSLSGTTLRALALGNAPSLIASAPGTADYAALTATFPLGSISARLITAHVLGGQRAIGERNPPPTLQAQDLATGDSIAVLGTATFSGPGVVADGFTPAGSYPISAILTGTDPRYIVTVQPGTLVISTLSANGSDPAAQRGASGCGVGTGIACLVLPIALRRRRST